MQGGIKLFLHFLETKHFVIFLWHDTFLILLKVDQLLNGIFMGPEPILFISCVKG